MISRALHGAFLGLALLLTAGNAPESSTDDLIQSLVDQGDDASALVAARWAAGNGDARAHEWLGWFYDNGRGVDADLGQAVFHYRIAIDGGQNYSRWRMGVLIDEGIVEGSLEEAVALFEAAAAEDFTNAKVSLAVMKATGRGTPLDYEGSFKNYLEAAEAGNSHGIQGVGVLFALGQGVDSDILEAASWFLVSSVSGNDVGNANFERITEGMSESEMAQIVARAQDIANELELEVSLVFEETSMPPD